MIRLPALFAALFALASPAVAHAAPPANDARANARPVSPPTTVSGTTVGATTEVTDPYSCDAPASTVWYSVTGHGRRIVVNVNAGGAGNDLDPGVAVYRKTRSQLSEVGCDVGDASGKASLDFRAEGGVTYLIRVARRTNSEEGAFSLRVQQAALPATPPGKPLPARGVSRTLDRVLN